jgi:hypothetical protein
LHPPRRDLARFAANGKCGTRLAENLYCGTKRPRASAVSAESPANGRQLKRTIRIWDLADGKLKQDQAGKNFTHRQDRFVARRAVNASIASSGSGMRLWTVSP